MGDYNWQKNAVVRLASKAISAIVAACGTGKTRAGIRIAVAKYIAKRIEAVVVIVPKNLTRQWRDDILEIAGPDEEVFIYDLVKDHKNPGKYAAQFEEFLDGGKTKQS